MIENRVIKFRVGLSRTVEMGGILVRIEDSNVGKLLVTMSSAREVVLDVIGC